MRWAPLLLLAVTACEGSVLGGLDGLPGVGGVDPIAPGGGPTQPVDPLALRCRDELSVAWGPLRRVTHEEYDSAVQRLLDTTATPSTTFPAQARAHGFTNGSALQTVGELQVERYADAAEALATAATNDLPRLLACDVAAQGEATCAHRFIDRFAPRAFRRPLEDTERTALREAYARARREQLSFRDGIEVVLLAVLQSPKFLYHLEEGAPASDGLVKLNGATVAARLATALWQSLPDDALTAAALSGELDTKEGVEAQVRRMLADPRAKTVLVRLFLELTRADEVDRIDKDARLFPTWSAQRTSLKGEAARFLESVLFDGDGKLSTLLTAQHTFVDAELARLYQLPAVTVWTRVSLGASPRGGLLTLGSVMAVNAKANQSSPVLRGLFVREHLLCTPPPPPPQNANIVAPDVVPGVSTRERFRQHIADPSCAGCHQMMDPIGLGFENFDAVGGWRTTDEGFAVTPDGYLYGSDVEGAFLGAEDLASRLARSAHVTDCMGTQAFRFFAARHEADADTCSIYRANQAARLAKGDVKELVVALLSSDAFRYRKVAP
ncbi:MAG: DUF1588 domain-containing protein [Myxococcaceae bacterium]|nr:DUF1588 domain-containing protein [Myxococcaceae bacterium]